MRGACTRASAGTHSLAIATTFNCSRTAFTVVQYPCSLGTPVSFAGKTLTFKVYFEGPAFLTGPVEPYVTILTQPSRTIPITPAVNTWITVSIPFGAGDTSIDGFSFSTYMQTTGPGPAFICGTWAGTVYLDGFTVQCAPAPAGGRGPLRSGMRRSGSSDSNRGSGRLRFARGLQLPRASDGAPT